MNFLWHRSTSSLFRGSMQLYLKQTEVFASYFSVTRNKLGRSESEMKKEQGVPQPPPIEIPHCRRDIRIAPKKMLMVANLIARMPIEEAKAQCQFCQKNAAIVVREILEEAQDIAVKQYGVEDRTNLYVDTSHVGRGQHLKRIKFHGRGRFGTMRRYYCHYFVVLKEGVPPGKNVKRQNGRYLSELERKLKYPKTIKNSLAWW